MNKVKIGEGIKKPIPVNVYSFEGIQTINTIEGQAYKVSGKTHYILQGIKGEEWPIDKKIFNETYTIIEKGDD